MLFLLICRKNSWTELWTFAFSQSGRSEAWESQTASPCFRIGSWTQMGLLLCDQRSEQDGERAFFPCWPFCSRLFHDFSTGIWVWDWQPWLCHWTHQAEKSCLVLPSCSLKGTQEESLLTQWVDGIKEINLGQVKFVHDLQRHVDFHRKIFIPGKSDEDGRSLWGLKGHIFTFNPCRKRLHLGVTVGLHHIVGLYNSMLLCFLANQWFWCTWRWKRVKWVTFLLSGSK